MATWSIQFFDARPEVESIQVHTSAARYSSVQDKINNKKKNRIAGYIS
jgi:hypothetical protein